MSRYFQCCKGYESIAQLPQRSTAGSAGYDFMALNTVTLPSVFSILWKWLCRKKVEPTLVTTGIKAKMYDSEVLYVFNRSSNPFKGIILANGVGVVDSDYYGNKTNDGNISFAFYNIFPFPVTIQRGQKIGQGVFAHFLKVAGDNANNPRNGGYGSTDAK